MAWASIGGPGGMYVDKMKLLEARKCTMNGLDGMTT